MELPSLGSNVFEIRGVPFPFCFLLLHPELIKSTNHIQDRGLQPILSPVVLSALSAQESTPRHDPQSKAAALPKLTALPWVIRA